MSRIQDILAKAERDGTARRTQTDTLAPTRATAPAPVPFAPVPSSVSTTASAGTPRVDGTSALDTFAPAPIAVPPTAQPGDVRTAIATLHPFLVAAINPHSPVSEQYRTLRSRISHREETAPLRTLMITSPGAGDGKSITAANLALTMAQEFQRRVVLVDGDFRGSAVHALFGLPAGPGLAELLAGEATLEDVMVYMPDYRLTVIPSGGTPQYPTELLGSTAMRRVVDTLRARFDRVLFDMPAVTPLADVGTVSPLTDAVLMVVRAGVTQRPALNQALSAFDEDKVLGVVLNDAR